jgi:hypothetical protein
VYGCETRSLSPREEHEAQGLENRALKEISASKKDEISEQFKVLYKEELRDLYIS